MAVLSDANLKKYKTAIDGLSQSASSWKNLLENASTQITKGVGSDFRLKYTKGQEASTRIENIVNTLKSLDMELKTIVKDGKNFYTQSVNAAKKQKK